MPPQSRIWLVLLALAFSLGAATAMAGDYAG
ncbi:MAG: hypothetical protein QOJ15_9922, partial [Bradyrhizobium sp.]|nr:hypothetical protein [Bradyrhizobium sp.]